MNEYGLSDKPNRLLNCGLDSVARVKRGQVGMLEMPGGVGTWMNVVVSWEDNWLAQFRDSVKEKQDQAKKGRKMALEEITVEVDEARWEGHPRITVTSKSELPPSQRVTPAMLERRAFRANKPFIPREIQFNEEATPDTIRHFVRGMGDPNPLFGDANYAAKTKYGCRIAPGSFLYSHQFGNLAGGFAGLHGWYSGGDWEWYGPIREGTKLTSVVIVRELAVKPGRMAGGGNIYLDYDDVVYLNAESGEILGKELVHNVWSERGAAGDAKKEFGKPKPLYSRADWLKILELYDREVVRGSVPRCWEDVQVGDAVGPLIKGPLTVRDELAWLMGAGSPFCRAHGLEFEYERRHPKVLEYVDETGEADVPELVHVLDQFARQIGVERAYDYVRWTPLSRHEIA